MEPTRFGTSCAGTSRRTRLMQFFARLRAFRTSKRRARIRGCFLVEFDALRHKAESETRLGGGVPEALVSVQRMRSASSSLGFSTIQKNPVSAKQMRRPFGACGGAARQYVLVAADVDAYLEVESDYASRAAYRRAKKKGKEDGGLRRKKRRK